MDGEEQTYEENRKLFGSFICNYHHTSFDYTAASVHRGRGDHFKYLSFNDDTCHHHDDPGATGILYFSIAAADHDPVSAWGINVSTTRNILGNSGVSGKVIAAFW